MHLSVGAGEIVSLLGRNGSGRSTTLKTIMGLVPPSSGAVRLDGADLAGVRAYRIVARRARVCARGAGDLRQPDGGREHARRHAGGAARRPGLDAEADVYGYFPQIEERRDTKAGMLSGGEQQMLTICRSLLGNPRVILIDEPTEGLAPMIVEVVTEVIRDICRQGVSVLLVEQKPIALGSPRAST